MLAAFQEQAMRGVFYIAWKDNGADMIPVSHRGKLVLFGSLEESRNGAGPLGVGVAVGWGRVLEICKQYGLDTINDRPEKGSD